MTCAPPRLLLHLVWLVALAAGCVTRHTLREHDYSGRIFTEADGPARIRLYVDRRLVIIRDDLDEPSERIAASIDKQGRRKRLRYTISKRTAGKLIAVDDRNHKPLLWLTFDPACAERSCAFGFVASDDGSAFRLAVVPDNPIFARERVYARRAGLRRPLRRGYVAARSEANPIYRGLGPARSVLVVALDYYERRPPLLRRSHRAPGVPFHEDQP